MKFEDVLNEHGYLVYTNVGISMMPIIREGKDLVYIKKIDRPLRFFDAVLFKRPHIKGRGEYVLHRILKVNKDHTYFIIGDNSRKGETVKEENILGILVSVKRDGKEIKCDSLSYRIFIYFWYLIYPIRMIVKIIKKIIRETGKLFK